MSHRNPSSRPLAIQANRPEPRQRYAEQGVEKLSRQVVHSTRRLVRSFRDNLELGTLLAFIAGIVNTVAFLQFGTFVSHISGNVTRAAVEYTEAKRDVAFVFVLEMAFFVFGAFATSFLLRGHTAANARIKYTVPIMIEAALIASFIVFLTLRGFLWFQIGNVSLATLFLAVAMGMQNAMLRHTSGAIIRTTHMTGVATDLGIELGAALSVTMQYWQRSDGWSASRFRGLWRSFWQRLGVGRFFFQILLFSSFFLGAIVGTLGFLRVTIYVLLFPVVILVLIGLREHARVRPGP